MSSLVEIHPVVLEKRIFKFRLCIFCYFVIISPWKWAWLFILKKNWISSPKDALCKVSLKWAKWFFRRRWKCEKFTDGQTDGGMGRWTDGQTDNSRSENLTWAFSSGELKSKRYQYLHFEKRMILFIQKKSLFPKDFGWNRFAISQLYPLERNMTFHLRKTWILFPTWILCAKFGCISPVVLEQISKWGQLLSAISNYIP